MAAPFPSSPKIFSSGTGQFSKKSSAVFDPLIPSLSSFLPVEKPVIVFSIINAVIPFEPPLGSVLAYTTKVSASGPLVIHIFEPFNK